MKLIIALVVLLPIFCEAKFVPTTNTDNRVLQDPVNKQPIYYVIMGSVNTTTGAISGSTLYDIVNGSKSLGSNDPGFFKLSATASSFITVTITANSGSYFHPLLSAPGAGLKYRIKQFSIGVSGGCLGTNTILISLASNGVDIPGTMFVPYVPNSVQSLPGGWTSPWYDGRQTFLVTGYNEALQWHLNGTLSGGACVARINVEYETIH